MVVAGTVLTGMGVGLTIPTTNLIVSARARDRQAAALSGLNLAWSGGAMTWPIVVAGAGSPTALLLLAATLGIVGLRMLRWTNSTARPATEASVPISQSPRRHESVAHFASLFFLYGGVETGLGGWLTEYTTRLDPSAGRALTLLPVSAFWGGLTIGRAVSAWKLSNKHASRVALGGGIVACVAIGMSLFPSDLVTILAAAAVAGVGLAPIFPATVAAWSRAPFPRIASSVIAVGSLGGAVLPWGVGAASTWCRSPRCGQLLLFVSCAGLTVLLNCRRRAGSALEQREDDSSAPTATTC